MKDLMKTTALFNCTQNTYSSQLNRDLRIITSYSCEYAFAYPLPLRTPMTDTFSKLYNITLRHQLENKENNPKTLYTHVLQV